jgi:hypothetical protein
MYIVREKDPSLAAEPEAQLVQSETANGVVLTCCWQLLIPESHHRMGKRRCCAVRLRWWVFLAAECGVCVLSA